LVVSKVRGIKHRRYDALNGTNDGKMAHEFLLRNFTTEDGRLVPFALGRPRY